MSTGEQTAMPVMGVNGHWHGDLWTSSRGSDESGDTRIHELADQTLRIHDVLELQPDDGYHSLPAQVVLPEPFRMNRRLDGSSFATARHGVFGHAVEFSHDKSLRQCPAEVGAVSAGGVVGV